MKWAHLYTGVLVLLFCGPLRAQYRIHGTVKDPSQQPLAYVNIGIAGKNIGTISDHQGQFQIDIPEAFRKDSLSFSLIGYAVKTIPLQQFDPSTAVTIELLPDTVTMDMVYVDTRKTRIKKIGIRSSHAMIFAPPINDRSGDIVEFAQKMSIKQPSKLLSSSLMIRSGRGDTVLLRINFYAEKNGQPGRRLNQVQVIKRLVTTRGWHQLDLSSYSLNFDAPFYISFEYLPTAAPAAFSFGCRLGGHTYTRSSSLGTWEKTPGASLSTYLRVRQ